VDELDAFLFELFALIEFDAALLAQIEEQRRIFADRLGLEWVQSLLALLDQLGGRFTSVPIRVQLWMNLQRSQQKFEVHFKHIETDRDASKFGKYLVPACVFNIRFALALAIISDSPCIPRSCSVDLVIWITEETRCYTVLRFPVILFSKCQT